MAIIWFWKAWEYFLDQTRQEPGVNHAKQPGRVAHTRNFRSEELETEFTGVTN